MIYQLISISWYDPGCLTCFKRLTCLTSLPCLTYLTSLTCLTESFLILLALILLNDKMIQDYLLVLVVLLV
jgi:hypothetical protein